MELPSGLKQSIGNQAIEKGDIAGQLKFYAWDSVVPCSGRLCPAFAECTCMVKNEVEVIVARREEGIEIDIPRCGVMQNYLTSIVNIIFRNYAEELSEAQLYRIGMGLIPAYRQLCRLQIAELGLVHVTFTNSAGNAVMHPLLRAINDQISMIEKLWGTIGLNRLDMNEEDIPVLNAYDRMDKEARNKGSKKIKEPVSSEKVTEEEIKIKPRVFRTKLKRRKVNGS